MSSIGPAPSSAAPTACAAVTITAVRNQDHAVEILQLLDAESPRLRGSHLRPGTIIEIAALQDPGPMAA